MTRIILLAGAAVFMAIAGSAQPAAKQAFDVASIRPSQTPQGKGLVSLREDLNTAPGSLTFRNVTLTSCIRWAYKLSAFEISGPDWLADARYDVTAKAATPAVEDDLRLMLQTLLTERFKVVFHRQKQDLPGYVLTPGKNGVKLTPAEGGGEGSMTGAALVFEGHKMPLSRLADIVSGALKVPVRDMTGLTGYFDFKLDLRPYLAQRQAGAPAIPRDAPGMQDALVDVATSALSEELGLKLEPRKIQLEVLVVDQAEKTPSEN
jgi:uncharacterized protein (TIGR03435 family)